MGRHEFERAFSAPRTRHRAKPEPSARSTANRPWLRAPLMCSSTLRRHEPGIEQALPLQPRRRQQITGPRFQRPTQPVIERNAEPGLRPIDQVLRHVPVQHLPHQPFAAARRAPSCRAEPWPRIRRRPCRGTAPAFPGRPPWRRDRPSAGCRRSDSSSESASVMRSSGSSATVSFAISSARPARASPRPAARSAMDRRRSSRAAGRGDRSAPHRRCGRAWRPGRPLRRTCRRAGSSGRARRARRVGRLRRDGGEQPAQHPSQRMPAACQAAPADRRPTHGGCSRRTARRRHRPTRPR